MAARPTVADTKHRRDGSRPTTGHWGRQPGSSVSTSAERLCTMFERSSQLLQPPVHPLPQRLLSVEAGGTSEVHGGQQ